MSSASPDAVTARGVLYVHSAPRALCPHIEWAVGRAVGHGVSFAWRPQPVLQHTQRAVHVWQGEPGTGAAIASALRGWEHLRFEVTEDASSAGDGGRWMHTPELGIYFGQTDSAGNLVVSEDRIRAALASAGGAFEIQRELRLALGEAWDEEIEPFRHAHEDAPVVWLHRAG